jgi:hypothetical protein
MVKFRKIGGDDKRFFIDCKFCSSKKKLSLSVFSSLSKGNSFRRTE